MLHSPGGAGPQASRPDIASREQAYRLKLGERGYARFEALKKQERQRGQLLPARANCSDAVTAGGPLCGATSSSSMQHTPAHHQPLTFASLTHARNARNTH
jgi:hypothetical protein